MSLYKSRTQQGHQLSSLDMMSLIKADGVSFVLEHLEHANNNDIIEQEAHKVLVAFLVFDAVKRIPLQEYIMGLKVISESVSLDYLSLSGVDKGNGIKSLFNKLASEPDIDEEDFLEALDFIIAQCPKDAVRAAGVEVDTDLNCATKYLTPIMVTVFSGKKDIAIGSQERLISTVKEVVNKYHLISDEETIRLAIINSVMNNNYILSKAIIEITCMDVFSPESGLASMHLTGDLVNRLENEQFSASDKTENKNDNASSIGSFLL